MEHRECTFTDSIDNQWIIGESLGACNKHLYDINYGLELENINKSDFLLTYCCSELGV